MARLPRLYAPSIVQYVVQQAAPGLSLFDDEGDYAVFLQWMVDALRCEGVALHAYALLPRRIELVATPRSATALSRAMQAIGRRYAPYLNRKTARTGALWTRRYRSTLVEADAWLLPTMGHVEAKPVAEGLVAEAGQWRWSSHAHHVGTAQQAFVSDHPVYWSLSDAPFERQAAYRALFASPLDAAAVAQIDRAVMTGWLLGGPRFHSDLAPILNRRGAPRPAGRPSRSVPD